jgi:hypothetical protein
MRQLNNKETADISGAFSFNDFNKITYDEFKALWKGPLVENKAVHPIFELPYSIEPGLPVLTK